MQRPALILVEPRIGGICGLRWGAGLILAGGGLDSVVLSVQMDFLVVDCIVEA